MLTDFGLARMAQCTQAFFKTTANNGKYGSLRWMAYELVIQDIQSESDDDSLVENEASHNISAVGSARTAEKRNIDLVVPGARNEAQPTVSVNHGSRPPEVKEYEEDVGPDEYHTKEADMWAFGMVIYVRGFIVLSFTLTYCD